MLDKIYKIIEQSSIDKEELMKGVPILRELDALEFFHPAHSYGVLDHSIKAAETLDDLFLRLVMIFHDIGKLRTAQKVPNRMKQGHFITKFPEHQIESVRIVNALFGNEMDNRTLLIFSKLIEYHDTPLVNGSDETVMQQLIQQYGLEFVSSLLRVQRADMSTHKKEYYESKIKPKLDYVCDAYEKKYLIK